MTDPLARLPVTLKLQTELAGISPDGHPAGLSNRPRKQDPPGSGTWVDLEPPYAILYSLWQTLEGPPFGADRHADVWWTYQVTLLAKRGDQLELMRDRLNKVIFATTEAGGYVTSLDAGGAKIIDREPADDAGADTPVDGVYPSSMRFRLKATPA
jgi:hypothetical protein